MSVNEEGRQVELAASIEAASRTLAHSTRRVPRPFDSNRLLAELSQTQDHLAQVLDQLSAWHSRVSDGVHYDGEDENAIEGICAPPFAAGSLNRAAENARISADYIRKAHAANNVVRWFDDVPEADQV